jgi:hypothetical protein
MRFLLIFFLLPKKHPQFLFRDSLGYGIVQVDPNLDRGLTGLQLFDKEKVQVRIGVKPKLLTE